MFAATMGHIPSLGQVRVPEHDAVCRSTARSLFLATPKRACTMRGRALVGPWKTSAATSTTGTSWETHKRASLPKHVSPGLGDAWRLETINWDGGAIQAFISGERGHL